jgi:hypothetical protein
MICELNYWLFFGYYLSIIVNLILNIKKTLIFLNEILHTELYFNKLDIRIDVLYF